MPSRTSWNVLITGGAGFIGSHLADELLGRGHRVRVLDHLSPQVHGEGGRAPEYLSPEVDLRIGDVRDPGAVREALEGVDCVCHLAAAVGVGQSMYEITSYTSCNGMGTAELLQALTERPVERLVVASSMSIYGEGLYVDDAGRPAQPVERRRDDLRRGDWEVKDAEGRTLRPVRTPETKQPALASVYALGKFEQEQMCLTVGKAYDFPTTALRLFNVYGPRQSLSNPYTGVLAIFLSRLLQGEPPLVYEDGLQRRDFVSVHDVARAFRLALETPGAAGEVINIGSGEHQTILEIGRRVATAVGLSDIQPKVTGSYRTGDVRHCFADIGRARELLGFEPRVRLEDGLRELAAWLEEETGRNGTTPGNDFERANRELAARGLVT